MKWGGLAAADLICPERASSLGEYPQFALPAILPYPHAWRYQNKRQLPS